MKYKNCLNLGCIIGGIAIVIVYLIAFTKPNEPIYLIIPLGMCFTALCLILIPLCYHSKQQSKQGVEQN